MFKLSNEFTTGGSLQGELYASYDQLVAAFGEPNCESDYKVSTEWMFIDDNNENFTIYEYKMTNLYDGNNPTVEQFREDTNKNGYYWHIGCNDVKGVNEFIEFIKTSIEESKNTVNCNHTDWHLSWWVEDDRKIVGTVCDNCGALGELKGTTNIMGGDNNIIMSNTFEIIWKGL